MQIRPAKSSQAKVDQQMTPLIDVVFQLLVFFVMSFKVASVEGDFNVKMPQRGQAPDPTRIDLPSAPLKLRLVADGEGQLTSLSLNQQPFPASDWRVLQSHLLRLVGRETGPGSLRDSLEVELDCDYRLRYDHAIAAVTAISGIRSESGDIVPLLEHVKFAPPRKPGAL
jgi:biopolymer transport protein ExbD